jgi:hypothetical protein
MLRSSDAGVKDIAATMCTVAVELDAGANWGSNTEETATEHVLRVAKRASRISGLGSGMGLDVLRVVHAENASSSSS